MTDIEKLEALAKAATPGPWHAWQNKENSRFTVGNTDALHLQIGRPYGGNAHYIADFRGPQWPGVKQPDDVVANANLMAACSPDKVLELIATIRTLQSELAAARAGNDAVWNEAVEAAELAAFGISSIASEAELEEWLEPIGDAIRALTRPTHTPESDLREQFTFDHPSYAEEANG